VATKRKVTKLPQANVPSNDEKLAKLIDAVTQMSFKIDELTHVICALVDNRSKRVCPICEGSGKDKANEEVWKVGGVYLPDKKCANCQGEGKI
jgi:DnaJ-class molecular chaperone